MLLSACSQDRVLSKSFENDDSPNYEARWFEGEADYSFKDKNGQTAFHPFYDAPLRINLRTKNILFFPVEPAKSKSMRKFDLISGSTYTVGPYCEQADVWGSYSNTIYKPNFTLGIMPRVFDRLGRAQEVAVFGNDEYYQNKHNKKVVEVRVVGGVIQQICPIGNCTGAKSWLSRMILIAVDPNDGPFKNVTNLSTLKKEVNWDYFKAFIENGNGRNIVGGSPYPGYRLAGEVYPLEALKYVSAQGKKFTNDKLRILKKSCHQLYDFVWKHVGNVEESKNKTFSKNELARIKSLNDKRVAKMSRSQKKEKMYFDVKKYNFPNNLLLFLSLFEDEYQTCIDYVKTSNINANHRRHWFFAYLNGVMKLFDNDNYFNCYTKNWVHNSKNINDRNVVDHIKELQSCNEVDINEMFAQVPVKMDSFSKSGHKSYRYIDYDNGYFGTHAKIYNWTSLDNKELQCEEPLFYWPWETKPVARKKMIFPEDVTWLEIKTIVKKKEDEYIR